MNLRDSKNNSINGLVNMFTKCTMFRYEQSIVPVTQPIRSTTVFVRATIRLPDMTFDESYNMREAVDFLSEKIGVREKLIQSAKQFSEKNGSQKFGITVKRFEDLYADFLRLYQPLLEKIAGHKEAIQRDIDSQKDVLTGVLGMIQVARGVEVLADRVRELEAEAKGIEGSIGEKEKTLARIDELLSRVKRQTQTSEAPRAPRQEEEDIFGQTDDFTLGLRESATKPGSARKTPSR